MHCQQTMNSKWRGHESNKEWSVILTACQKSVNAGIIAYNYRFATAAVALLPAAANTIVLSLLNVT